MGLLDNQVIQSILSKFKSQAGTIGQAASVLSYAQLLTSFGKMVMAMVSELVAELDNDPTTIGADKKKLVKDAAGELFDSLSGSLVNLSWVTAAIWPITAPYVRSFFVEFAGGLVEWSLEKIRSNQLAVKPS